jgi:hypothetical protein
MIIGYHCFWAVVKAENYGRESIGWSKAAHLMMDRKQKAQWRGRVRGQDTYFKGTFPVTYFPQPGPTS